MPLNKPRRSRPPHQTLVTRAFLLNLQKNNTYVNLILVIIIAMPITKSAKKALRQSVKKRANNIRRKKKFRSLVKEFRNAIAAKTFDKAKELLPKVYKALDKASKSNTIKKNTSSRTKSRLSVLLNKSSK